MLEILGYFAVLSLGIFMVIACAGLGLGFVRWLDDLQAGKD